MSKVADQEEIHSKALSTSVDNRRDAARAIGSAFSELHYKDQAWNDLDWLAQDEDSDVLKAATRAIGSVFSELPDKDQAWEDLIRLVQDEDNDVLEAVAEANGSTFSALTDKGQNWEDLHRLVQDDDSDVREAAAEALGSSFAELPDKDCAWEDLHRLVQDDDSDVRETAARAIGPIFAELPDKEMAWEDLHHLVRDKDIFVRLASAVAIGSAFAELSDKNQAWEDLHHLVRDEDIFVRLAAARAIGSSFVELPDKDMALKDMAWITKENDSDVRETVAVAIGSSFAGLPDKDMAWEVLHNQVQDEDIFVRRAAAGAIGSSFAELPDKDMAWEVLHHLAQDKETFMRLAAARAIGSSFADLPDKDMAWEDLQRLSGDTDGGVRSYGNHSLGRASIKRATESNNDDVFREEIERAIRFFEDASRSVFNPSLFCLPFYRSFYAITFKKLEAETEVKQYLKIAKRVSQGQKSKEMLVRAIENLSEALLEVKRLEGSDLDLMKCDLKSYEKYCSRVGELLAMTEEYAPGAVLAVRRGLPIIDRRIKIVLKQVEDKAASFCRAAKGTPLAEPGRRAFDQARGLEDVKYQDEANKTLKALVTQVRGYCTLLPTEIREQICEKLKGAESEGSLEKGFAIIAAFAAMTTFAQDMKDDAQKTQKLIDDLIGQIIAKLKEMDFRVSRLYLLSSNAATSFSDTVAVLKEMRGRLEYLASLGPKLELLQYSVKELDQSLKEDLEDKDKTISELVQDMKRVIEVPGSNDKEILLKRLDELKEPMPWNLANRAGALASIIGLFLTAYSMYHPLGT